MDDYPPTLPRASIVNGRQKNSIELWLTIVVSGLLPMLLGYTMESFFTEWRWSHYPFHAMLEGVGALSALMIAILMLTLVNNGHFGRHYVVAACALIGMGLLDGFHSILNAGASFIWLHSIATMAGGVIFSAIWLPESWITAKRQSLMLWGTISSSLLVGIISITLPDIIPTMIVDGKFSQLAILINIIGGIGFLVGASYFIYHYLFSIKGEGSYNVSRENLVFANHCLLFGIAGLLFENSVLWDAGWWWWHILRFSAYLVVLVYFFSLMKKGQEQLKISEANLAMLNISLEQRVKERTQDLEIANAAKTEFLACMSHELRTPLNAILGFGQILQMDNQQPLNKLQAKNLQEIMNAGHNLLALINEVLDLSRIESGRLELNLRRLPMVPIIGKCVRQMIPLATKRSIKIKMKIDDSFTAVADETRFKQVIINLLSNAIKYNNEGGSINIGATAAASGFLRINVADTGIGVDEDRQQRIFMPFECFVSADGGAEGIGIGLALANKLVIGMRGKMGVISEPGKGSTFWFELPT